MRNVRKIGVNTSNASNSLARRIVGIASKFTNLMNSLSPGVRPHSFIGFGDPMPTENTPVLLGWNYDWSDKGDNPPPWSDWGDKT